MRLWCFFLRYFIILLLQNFKIHLFCILCIFVIFILRFSQVLRSHSVLFPVCRFIFYRHDNFCCYCKFHITARSPVFTHLNATLNGLTTIRAYCAQDILKREFDKLQDQHTSTAYMYIVTSTAFGFFLDIFCFVFTSLVTFSFLILNECKF